MVPEGKPLLQFGYPSARAPSGRFPEIRRFHLRIRKEGPRMTKLGLRAIAPAAGLLALHLTAGAALAQQPQLDLPRPSPNATVSQMVGVTKISIQYSLPCVKGRKIWGELVPYVYVWDTGANENTTITFSTPVKVGGQELP